MQRNWTLVKSVRRLIPSPLIPAIETAYRLGFRMRLKLRCRITDTLDRIRGSDPKLPPAMLRFRVSESVDANEFYRIGSGCAHLIEQSLQSTGRTIAPGLRILDFGCGCGRTLRWLLVRHPESEFYGVDVDVTAIEWCIEHLQPGRFKGTSALPPLPFPAGHFDVVYSISVFTHLDQHMQDVWLSELRRILKSDGVLLITVHGPKAAEALDSEGRDQLKQLGFLHRKSTKLKAFVPDWYHTTWHTEKYIIERVSSHFTKFQYRTVKDGLQDVVVGWGSRPAR
jgi:SAM-dependent methyltransferase